MASLTIYKHYQNNTELSNPAMRWVGTVAGYSGYFGCIYSFTPDVKAKKLTFALAFDSVSNDRRIYYKVSSSPAYDYETQGPAYFTTQRSGSDERQSLTASFDVDGTFEAGTTYYLFLQSTYAGDVGYLDNISGSVAYTKALTAKVWTGSAWKDATAVKVWTGSAWKDASAVKAWNGSAWKSA